MFQKNWETHTIVILIQSRAKDNEEISFHTLNVPERVEKGLKKYGVL